MVVFHSKLLVTTGGSGEKSPTSGFLGTPEKQQWGRPPKKYHSNVNWSNAFGGFPILLPIHLYVHSSICEILYIYICMHTHLMTTWLYEFFFDKSPVTRSPLHLTEVRKDADGTSCSVRTTRPCRLDARHAEIRLWHGKLWHSCWGWIKLSFHIRFEGDEHEEIPAILVLSSVYNIM